MRNHLLSGGLTLILVAACGAPVATSTSSSSSACAGANNSHRAYVVVEHQSGATMQNCVGFSGDVIDGQTLMDRSGIQYEAHSVSSGKVVCQVDFEPKQFSQCFPANQPYWALFVESGGKWTSAPGGFSDVRLHDREALGWHYVGAMDPSPAPPPLAKKF
jgi:hypothetical protein